MTGGAETAELFGEAGSPPATQLFADAPEADHDDALELIDAAWRRGLEAEPQLSVSEWADRHRVLPTANAEPGPWRTDRVPYLREIMDCLSTSSPVERIVFMKGAQTGGTEAALNAIGYWIAHAPGIILTVWPSIDMVRRNSRIRIEPLIDGTPALRAENPAGAIEGPGQRRRPERISGRRARHDRREQRRRPALAAGALSRARRGRRLPAGRRRRGRSRRLGGSKNCDFPRPAQDRPDFHADLRRRIAHRDGVRRKRPTAFLRPMPALRPYAADRVGSDCLARRPAARGAYGLRSERLRHRGAGQAEDAQPRRMAADCGGRRAHRRLPPAGALSPVRELGGYRRRIPDRPTRSAPAATLDQYEARPAVRGPRRRPVRGGQALERLEDWGDGLPEHAAVITAGVDVQGDRLAVEIVGWGLGEESWSLDYSELWGDPAKPDVWAALDHDLLRRFDHPRAGPMPVRGVCVDSGGHWTQRVYQFARERAARNVWAIKGRGGPGVPCGPGGLPGPRKRFLRPSSSASTRPRNSRRAIRLSRTARAAVIGRSAVIWITFKCLGQKE